MLTNAVVVVRDGPAGSKIGNQDPDALGTTTDIKAASLNGTPYMWFRVNFDKGADGWVAHVGLDRVPTIPINLRPGTSSSPGPTVDDTSVTLRWDASDIAEKYEVGLRDVTSNTLISIPLQSGTSYTANLQPGRRYKWYVQACNSAGCSGFPSDRYFQTPLVVPSISSVSPTSMLADGQFRTLTINGSNFESGNVVQFLWGAPPNNFVWTTSKKTPSITSSRITVSMNPGTETDGILVRVCRSASATTSADCSASRGVSVKAIEAPMLTSPANYATGVSLTPTLSRSGGYAIYWEVTVRDKDAGTTAYSNVVSGSQSNDTIPSGRLQAGRLYKWDVAACPTSTCDSGWKVSGDRYFTTTSSTPTTWWFSPSSKTVGEDDGTVTFTLNRSPSTDTQTVYLSTVQDQGSANDDD